MTTPANPDPTPAKEPSPTPDALLAVVASLLPADGSRPPVTLDSRLDRDLGLDSLTRAELLARLQRAFALDLPEDALLAETPRQLLTLLERACLGDRRAQERPAAAGPVAAGAVAGAPVQAHTLMEVLDWHLQRHPERVHLLMYGEGDDPEPLSHAQLAQGAEAIAAGLAQRGVRAGDRVALLLPTGPGYFFSFFGILLAGGVPVPIYPPARPNQLEEHLRRHARILDSAGVGLLITVPEGRGVARLLRSQVPSLRQALDWAELGVPGGARPALQRGADDLAFLQYTSGSTGDPKGVMLSHAHLLANIRAMGQAAAVDAQDVFVSWLPLYHDMGLIGAWLGSLYYAMPLVVMSPLRFLARPSRWLWAIHRHGGTLSAAPNFAYELCLSKIPPEELEGLDLRTWRRAFNGAEPVSAATLNRFADRFAGHGLRPEALAPVYGLAEAAVGLSFPPPHRGPRVDRIQRQPFMQYGVASPAPEEDAQALELVACGRPLPGYRVQVVDGAGQPLPERREGRLEFQGPSATQGYFANPDATRRLFRDGWLDTGDRAYIADGELFLTGRSKEMIIRAGRNLYPYELEQAVGALPGVRTGCVAAFASPDPASGTERLILVAETRERDPARREALRGAIRERATDLLGLPPDLIELVPPHSLLKTSSGKLRRGAVRALYESGRLGRGGRALPWQVLRLLGTGLLERLGRHGRRVLDYLFAAWAWTLFALLVPGVWLAVVLLPRPGWRWATIRGAIRVLRGLTGIPLEVVGREHLPPPGQPWVLVANHTSYLDSLALIEAIPRELVYVAKRELTGNFFARLFLERLGTLFVERFDVRRGAAEARAFLPRLRAGQTLAFYPEGTFRAEPGLLPFRMGAFLTAAEGGAPLVPVTLRGARAMLRGDRLFPHRGALQVRINPSLEPTGPDWEAAARLRDQARALILAQCGEADLDATPPPSGS